MSCSLFDLKGRMALVTGSSQGIGLSLAKALAKQGAQVVLNARDETKLSAAQAQLKTAGLDVYRCAFDVSDHSATEEAIARIENDIGPIDIAINNAGIQYRESLEAFPVDRWEQLLAVNVSGTFHVSRAVAKYMLARGRGKIINVASVQSELARSSIGPYTATKGAVRNLTRAMAAEWARYGLQINALAPGYFKTPLNSALASDPEFTAWLETRTPAGRWGEVDELSGAAIFLASDASNFVNGHTLFVDGGISIAL
ncbi:SDR family oxidoreductase [Microbaculum marinisediminis]|uniref:SDR family oxidoreductase n=1 Tax=Microbaculum marinisediminis TaxID=2931392 RepID=A0AAW5R4C0_9HYPH|nr:SDR family oxidoreductase [Microbaculum sp. A6E488]MCT8973385.1 SDR family oxidoreductase [Microbaculum sp. A6E488]